MKLKTIVTLLVINATVLGFCQGQQLTVPKKDNLIVKEVAPQEAILMLRVVYKNEKEISSTYAAPLFYKVNGTDETLPMLRLSLENCCSNKSFFFEHFAGFEPIPYWNGSGGDPLNGKSISFPGSIIQHNQIKPNDKVHISHFLVHAADGAGTAIIFLTGPLEELKKAYVINVGQLFDWERSKRVIRK